MLSRAFAAFAATLCAVTSGALAQQASSTSWVPLNEAFIDISEVLADIPARSKLYFPDANDQKLHIQPFLVFRKDEANRIARVVEVFGTDTSRVILTLVNTPNQKRHDLYRWLRAQDGDVFAQFKQFTPANIVPLPFVSLSITQQTQQGEPELFPSLSFIGFDDYLIPISSILLPHDQAKRYAELLNNSTPPLTDVTFRLDYRLAAKFKVSAGSVNVRVTDILNINATKELVGAGTLFQSEVQKGKWTIGRDGVYLIRSQRDRFAGDLKRDISVAYEIENREDLKLLERHVEEYLSNLFEERAITYDKDFLFHLERMSAYDFDQRDIAPDDIKKLMAKVTEVLQNKSTFKSNAQHEGELSVIGYGSAKGNFSVSSDQLREAMSNHGWDFALEGGVYRPKSLNVSVITTGALSRNSEFSTGITSSVRLAARATSIVSALEHRFLDATDLYRSSLTARVQVGTCTRSHIPLIWEDDEENPCQVFSGCGVNQCPNRHNMPEDRYTINVTVPEPEGFRLSLRTCGLDCIPSSNMTGGCDPGLKRADNPHRINERTIQFQFVYGGPSIAKWTHGFKRERHVPVAKDKRVVSKFDVYFDNKYQDEIPKDIWVQVKCELKNGSTEIINSHQVVKRALKKAEPYSSPDVSASIEGGGTTPILRYTFTRRSEVQ